MWTVLHSQWNPIPIPIVVKLQYLYCPRPLQTIVFAMVTRPIMLSGRLSCSRIASMSAEQTNSRPCWISWLIISKMLWSSATSRSADLFSCPRPLQTIVFAMVTRPIMLSGRLSCSRIASMSAEQTNSRPCWISWLIISKMFWSSATSRSADLFSCPRPLQTIVFAMVTRPIMLSGRLSCSRIASMSAEQTKSRPCSISFWIKSKMLWSSATSRSLPAGAVVKHPKRATKVITKTFILCLGFCCGFIRIDMKTEHVKLKSIIFLLNRSPINYHVTSVLWL